MWSKVWVLLPFWALTLLMVLARVGSTGTGTAGHPCYTLKRAPGGTTLTGGHTKECFKSAMISFETCRQLLYHSGSCFALSYKDKHCALHDRTNSNFKSYIPVATQDESTAIVFSKEVIVSTTSSPVACGDQGFQSALSKFMKCVDSPSDHQLSADQFRKLPKLGIVISVTSHWAQTHKAAIASITSNFECYAAAHKYVFMLNVMPDMPAEQFFHQRHYEVRTHLLPRFQNILHLDADSLVLNISRSLDAFIQPSSPHVQLHMNENGEVTAATYLIRNSPFAKCFLQYWDNFSPPRPSNNYLRESLDSPHNIMLHDVPYDERMFDVPNYDNGDLVAAAMNMLDPKFYLSCMSVVAALSSNDLLKFRNIYHQTVVECWKILHPNLHSLMNMERISGKFMIYLPKEGYWRTHGRRNRYGSDPSHWWNMMKGSCFPSSDIIGHGWKGMMRRMWPQVSDELGNFDLLHPNSTKLCRAAMEETSSGGNPNCYWLSRMQELKVASRYCNWRLPSCTREGSVCAKAMNSDQTVAPCNV
jgi:hypothetical protein